MRIAVSLACRWLALCLCLPFLCIATPASAQSAATLTVADGKPRLLRGAATYATAAGAALNAGDMLETGPKAQAQLEFADGLILNLGPESKLYLIPAATATAASFALAAGWMKAAVPAGRKGDVRALRYILSGLAVDTTDATVVLHASAGLDEVFVESGTAKASEVAHDGSLGKSLAAKGSDYLSRKEQQAAALGRPPQPFLGGMPRHFMDNLPALLGRARGAATEPVLEHDTTYAEARAWLDANALVRSGLAPRYQGRVKDAEFKSGLVADMSAHPEWERLLGPAKAAAKKK